MLSVRVVRLLLVSEETVKGLMNREITQQDERITAETTHIAANYIRLYVFVCKRDFLTAKCGIDVRSYATPI